MADDDGVDRERPVGTPSSGDGGSRPAPPPPRASYDSLAALGEQIARSDETREAAATDSGTGPGTPTGASDTGASGTGTSDTDDQPGAAEGGVVPEVGAVVASATLGAARPGAVKARSGPAHAKGRGSRRDRPADKKRRPKRSKGRVAVIVALCLVLVALVATGGSYVYLRYRYSQIKKFHVVAEQHRKPGKPFNLLVIGSDSRAQISPGQYNAFGNPNIETGQRSDVDMIWHVDPEKGTIQIVSIPRDTMVSVDSDQKDLGTYNRINSTYAAGPDGLVKTIEDNFGIPINHVIQVNFDGLEGAVDALGGVWMNFPYPSQDAYSGLNITQTGCQLLDGAQALSVARSRHFQYYANGYWQYDGSSDYGRIQRQDAFLQALAAAAKSKYNPATINAFLGSIPQGITIDDSFGLNELLSLAYTFHSFNPGALAGQTLPTSPNPYYADGNVPPWGDVLFVDQPASQEMLVSVFGSQLMTPTTPPPGYNLEPNPPPEVTTTTTTAPAPGSTTSAPSAPSTTTTTGPPPFDPTPCSPS